MKKMRKTMALFIVLTMVMSLMSFSVIASAEENVSSTKISDADIELSMKLETLGAITNEFELSNYVTRGEMASIAAKYVAVPASTGAQVFADVPPEHPYFGVITALYNMGVVTGNGNGNFGPDEYVTYDQALVYIINAIGHKPFAMREGGYPTGYHRVAIKYKMLEDISMNKGSDKATAIDIYKMLDKALVAPTVITSYYGDGDITYTLSDSETFLAQTYKIRQYRGIVTAVEGTRLISATSNVKADQIEINNKIYDLYGYQGFDLLGCSVDFYVSIDNVEEILYLEETAKCNERVKIDAVDLLRDKTTASRIYYRDDSDKEYHIDLESGFNMMYNNQCYDAYGILGRALPDNGYVEALDNDRNGIYDVLFVFEYENIVVDIIDSYNEKVIDEVTSGEEVRRIEVDLSTNSQIVDIRFIGQDRKASFESIQVGDVISVAKSKREPKVISAYISRNAVDGMIEAYDSRYGYYINGEWYKKANDYNGRDLELGLTGSFKLDLNDDIAYYSSKLSEKKSYTAVMSGIHCESGSFSTDISLRLYTYQGEFIYPKLNEKIKIDGRGYDLTKSEDKKAVLSALATEVSPGEYKVTETYVVDYTLGMYGLVTQLDLGGIEGPGKLNAQVRKSTATLLPRYSSLSFLDGTGYRIRERINTTSGIVFSAPSNADIDNLELYGLTSLVDNSTYVTGDFPAENFDIYSYESTKYPMADVVLIRGMEPASRKVGVGHSSGVILETASAVNDEGIECSKVYLQDSEYVIATEVYVTKNGSKRLLSGASLIKGQNGEPALLREGVAIQYSVNAKGELSAIRIVADFDLDRKILTPTFLDAETYVERDYDSSDGGRNFVAGIIEGYDDESKQMYFSTPASVGVEQYMLFMATQNITIYMSDTGKAISAKATDVIPGDQFVARLDNFYVPGHVIIFR